MLFVRLTAPYHDFNVSHAVQILFEHHELEIGRSTLDRVLKAEGVRRPKREGTKVKRVRRDRCRMEGQMLQIDGSPHRWLEDRGERLCLMGAIDDATGKVVYLRFHKTEDQAGYLLMLKGIALAFGLPMSYYHDRHTILRSPKEATLEEELQGKKPMSQVQRVLDQLGIESIAARSPQAKGRVERLWKTLQDRLVKEMRLQSVSTMDEANAFLPAFLAAHNSRFEKEAKDEETAWVPLPRDFDLALHFSTKETRAVQNDHTLAWLGKTLQVRKADLKKSLAGKTVDVHVTPEGGVHLYHHKVRLPFLVLEASSGKASGGQTLKVDPPKTAKPHPAHLPRSGWMDGFSIAHQRDADTLHFLNKLAANGHYP